MSQTYTFDRFLIIDFETTGNHPRNGDEIIQVGAVTLDGKEITGSFSSFIRPQRSIPPFITQLTGISEEMVMNAPLAEEVLPEILKLLDGRVLVAHNVMFDLAFLQDALERQGYHPFQGPVIDTVELSRILLPAADGYRLTDLSSALAVEHDRPHQADSDAQTTAEILLNLLDKLDKLPLITVQRLASLTDGLHSDIQWLFRDRERALLTKPELYETNQPAKNAEPIEVYRHLALRAQNNAEQYDKEVIFETFDQLSAELFRDGGILEREYPQFERRTSQHQMMNKIYDAFQSSRHLLVEAGTGTGKSLAYLIPALFWAKETGNKVVISTNTIQLQEQLHQRDIPLISKFWPESPKVAVIKGRNNYLCLRKFENSLAETVDDTEEIRTAKAQLLVWLTETETGDIEELNLSSAGQRFWKQVESEAHSSLNRHCPWFSRCFYHRSRQQAQEADVIITNHSLLLTDMKAEHRVLPSYQFAVIDEAHHFEDVASSHLGHSLHSYETNLLMNRLAGKKGGSLVEQLAAGIKDWDDELFRQMEETITRIGEQHSNTKSAIEELFQLLYEFAIRSRAAESDESGNSLIRFRPGELVGKWGEAVQSAAGNAIDELLMLARLLETLWLKVIEREPPVYLRGLAADLQGVMKECQNHAELLHTLLIEDDPSYVHWLEWDNKNKQQRWVSLQNAPIDVSELLRENFFHQKESIVMTSATISVNHSFDFPLSRLGLSDLAKQGQVETEILSSPFDYKSQTLLCVPTDFPLIKQVSGEEYTVRVAESLAQVAEVTNGRMLALFTSYEMLRNVYQLLKEKLAPIGIQVLGHGIDSSSRSILIRKFKSNKQSVLLGTSSFWEGVDIPGDSLSCLVIVRLPFLPPNHPVMEARTDLLEKQGRNSFMELSVPQAVIRFKQGFGRLVRTREDKGVILVFDRRIVEARYGRQFLQSLPETTVMKKPLHQLLPDMESWLG